MSRRQRMHQNEIPPGTLYLLILKALARGRELHGYEIAHWIEQVSARLVPLAGRGGRHSVDRLLERGWTAFHAQHRAAKRTGGPGVSRRQPPAPGSAPQHRKPVAFRCRGRGRPPARNVGQPAALRPGTWSGITGKP